MRKTTSMLLVSAVLLAMPVGAQAATGSFANRELGLGVSGFALLPSGADLVSWGLPLTIEAGFYLDNGLGVYLRVPLMLLQQKIGFGPDQASPGTILATGGQFGLRYMFLEETVRPYVMLQLAGLYMFRDSSKYGNDFYAGPGAGVGIDFFVSESVSLGLRATADLYITLNAPLLFSVGGGAYATTYF